MDTAAIAKQLNKSQDVIQLAPQVIGRFYGDGNRLGQRSIRAPKPKFYKPERWIGSSTLATNPPGIPSGGVSTCPQLGTAAERPTLKQLVADPDLGPRLLGAERYKAHNGTFRILLKLLDAGCPIPFHVHADDAFVAANPKVYPNEQFGKDEAYHFLDSPKGDCPYTHAGVFPGVTAKDIVTAMWRGTDHVLELSPGAFQNFGEGFYVKAGLFHRPGTALTLEIQQPSDVYTFFQTDFGGQPLAREVLHPGFGSIDEAAERVVNWSENLKPGLLESVRLKPQAVSNLLIGGGEAHWVFPPEVTKKFSGMRLRVDTATTFHVGQPCVLFVWKGKGTLDGRPIDGGGGPVGAADEFFLGAAAVKRGVEIKNTGDEPLVVFAMFAAAV